MDGFSTPPAHIRFLAKKLFSDSGEMIDGAISYLEPGGGGPTEMHTHPHNHLFVVVSGRVRVETPDGDRFIEANQSLLIEGSIPHSIWNDTPDTTVMLGISVRPTNPTER